MKTVKDYIIEHQGGLYHVGHIIDDGNSTMEVHVGLDTMTEAQISKAVKLDRWPDGHDYLPKEHGGDSAQYKGSLLMTNGMIVGESLSMSKTIVMYYNRMNQHNRKHFESGRIRRRSRKVAS